MLFAVLSIGLLALSSAATSDELKQVTPQAPTKTIVGLAAATPELSTLVTAIKAAGLLGKLLSGEGPFTVFAPSNKAFESLPAGHLVELLKPENIQQLFDLLAYHVLKGGYPLPSDDVINGGFLTTVEGLLVETSNTGGQYSINNARITTLNLGAKTGAQPGMQEGATNGVVHIIDTVLNLAFAPGGTSPPTTYDRATAAPGLSTFVTAVKAAGLIDTLSDRTNEQAYTVFAPSNKAFAALPAGTLANLLKPENKQQLADLLSYHVVESSTPFYAKKFQHNPFLETLLAKTFISTGVISGNVFIDTAQVIYGDIAAANGVVHIIDTVLNPAVSFPKTVVDFAVATPKLSTLVTALKAAGLVDTLAGKGPFTVFAPSNKAFDALPAGTLANLLKPENKAQLVDLLTYHVASGSIQAFTLEDKQKIATLEGQSATVRTVVSTAAPEYLGKAIFIDSAEVMFADNGALNGVVHIIDTVLMPRGSAPPTPPTPPTPAGKTVVDIAAATPELSTLVSALKAAGLVDTLSEEEDLTVFAPTNEAFAALPAGTLANLLKPENKAQLVDLLTYHVVDNGFPYFSKDLVKFPSIHTLEGGFVAARQIWGEIFINTAQVITADVGASNGVVHVINGVLNPQWKVVGEEQEDDLVV